MGMPFEETLSYLDSLVLHGVKVGLDHTRILAERLGSPHESYPSLLIAGTNGKGSTASFLSAILGASGLRVGLFTSPHLVGVRERIRVGDREIDEETFATLMEAIRSTAEGAEREGAVEGPPTYFEALTLLAFEHFKRQGVDLAVLEVGMGGRLDCTNIVHPTISVVTNIGRDHEAWLGEGVERIAMEKAGIFRKGVPALTAAVNPLALEVLNREAVRVGANLETGEEWAVSEGETDWMLTNGSRSMALAYPFLLGKHQLQNAALAVRTCWALRRLGWDLPDQAIRAGLASARWPGRLERVGTAPEVFLDGAHNPEGCEALARFVQTLPGFPKALVFAVMRDKSIEAMASVLFPPFQRVWATSVPMARCLSPEEIQAKLSPRPVHCVTEPERALEEAAAWAGRDGCVVVAGSLYLVGYFKMVMGEGFSPSWGAGY
jgi:dihydrofolate synthase/folylpolyglutamate synthase